MKPAEKTIEAFWLHCRGCGRSFALTRSRYVDLAALFCSTACFEDIPITANEERDALVAELALRGFTFEELSRLFGISKQRAHQIASSRVSV